MSERSSSQPPRYFYIAIGFFMGALFIAACDDDSKKSFAASIGNAIDVIFNDSTASLGATDVQAAIDALDLRLDAGGHVHSGADVTSGTVPFGQLPSGTTASTVSEGDHTHGGGSSVVTHESTTSGPHAIAADSTNVVLRTATYTPASPNDVIALVIAEGTYTNSGTWPNSSGSLRINLKDSAGTVIWTYSTGFTACGAPGSGEFIISGSLTNGSSNACVPVYLLPSSTYTFELLTTTNCMWVGQIDTFKFKFVTLEGVTVSSPSTNIVG